MAMEKLNDSKGQAWFCTTGLPSDIVIDVEDMSFHLHKFPLMSRSKKLHLLIADQEENPRRQRTKRAEAAEEAGIEEVDEDEAFESEMQIEISLPEFPGGSEIFELAAKFCYGVKIDLTPANVAPLRCAGQYLEMTEEFGEDNLVSKTERFLAQFVFRSLRDSIKTLKSCESLLPTAEVLAIPQRCIESIVARASSSDPSSLFGWPAGGGESRSKNPDLLNGIDAGIRRRNHQDLSLPTVQPDAVTVSWFDDLTTLSLPTYRSVISAMKERDLNSEIIESALIAYAKKMIPGLSRTSRKQSSAPSSKASESEQRELLEMVIANLPSRKKPSRSRRKMTTPHFLFGLLRTASILRAADPCRTELERKIAAQLEDATLEDLLMPSYSYAIETLYDVDSVERILACFLQRMVEGAEEDRSTCGSEPPAVNPLMLVGKLIDGYLAEVASDSNLSVDRFYDLAAALPDHARLFDDGLYRAVDIFLKAHPWVTEEEREKLCGLMSCHKLTLEACTHAAQNERLPLRAVVQVLFFEQIQLRRAIAGSLLTSNAAPIPPASSLSSLLNDAASASPRPRHPAGDGAAWRTVIRDSQVLRLDMDSLRSRVQELERECSDMRETIRKIDRAAVGGGWGSFTKKFGCKLRTQVCDSQQERGVAETNQRVRRPRRHQNRQRR